VRPHFNSLGAQIMQSVVHPTPTKNECTRTSNALFSTEFSNYGIW